MTQVQKLKDRIEELEELLGSRLSEPRPSALTPLQWKLVGILLKQKGKVVSREFAYRVIFGARSEADQPSYGEKTINTMVCRINKVLRSHQIQIRCEWGVGYFLDEWSRKRLEKLIEAKNGQ